MDSYKSYKQWLENSYFDKETVEELNSIKDNPKEIEERFYRELEFGTGGLRGILGAGTNRMNKYTVRKATQGLADYILKKGEGAKERGVVIAYDSRLKSDEFALETALVFAGNGIRAYLFNELKPTPELSFAVRFLNAAGGVVITASHNPKQYNGYKAYGEDGAQLSPEESDKVIDEVRKIFDITKVNRISKKEAEARGLLKIIGKEIDIEYMNCLKTLSVNPELAKSMGSELKIVYTPLHGTGNKPVRRLLDETGFKNVLVVKEQEMPDASFSTVKSPNPEDKNAYKLGIELANKENGDLIIATDPDCDRVGVMIKNESGQFMSLTGNQIGCLLMEYILSQKKNKGELPKNGFVVKTIVTSELARAISKEYNVEMVEVLTGFKFIGQKIKELDEYGDRTFIFGFEESYGYLAGTYSRDKDAVVASLLIAEMAAFFRLKGMAVHQALHELFEKYGYFLEDTVSFTLEGKDGQERIVNTMDYLRENMDSKFGTQRVTAIRDYLKQKRFAMIDGKSHNLELPPSNVLYYELGGSDWFCIRPSGTEPKIKIYFGISESDAESAESKLQKVKENVLDEVKKHLYA
ncbi:MAG: phospho-sugar mutase [Acetivibrionales bacterium]|jgi:phosphoglucomutase